MVTSDLKVSTKLTDIESKNGKKKTFSIRLNQWFTHNVQIFVREHNGYNASHNGTSAHVLVKYD